MSDAADDERALRIEQMTVNIEKMRSDMKWETRKFVVSTVLAAAALVGAGIAVGSYFTKQAGPPVIIQVPGPAK